MKFKLQDLGLSKDIQKYWDKINYNPTPEEWSMIIMNISRQPEYMKINHLKDLLKYYSLNDTYKKYCNDYIESYYSCINGFKELKSDQIFILMDDHSDIPIALSKDYSSIELIAKQKEIENDYAKNRFHIIKSNIYDSNNGNEYNVVAEYIIFDENHNIIDYLFNDILDFPWETIKFPTDFTSKDIFKYCFNDGLLDQYLFICLNCNQKNMDNNYPIFETDSSSGNGIKSIVYDPSNSNLYWDHSSPVFFERLCPAEYGLYPIYKELENCNGDGEKLRSLIENRKELYEK